MPRWIWILLAASLAALLWAANRVPSAPLAQPLAGQSAFSCITVPPASARGAPAPAGAPPI
ncbi:MAG: hypothetical protein K0M70_06715, partial [Arenimonas sp.]|nr:hypothetical protein [Arenimonas sp.]